MERKFILAVLLLTMITAVGCNATRGAGQDLEQTGENLQEAVEKND